MSLQPDLLGRKEGRHCLQLDLCGYVQSILSLELRKTKPEREELALPCRIELDPDFHLYEPSPDSVEVISRCLFGS
jgi:hypothetical protein